MSGLRIAFDMRDFERLGNMMAAAGRGAPGAARLAVNRTLEMARTAMRRPLVAQTGLKPRTIHKAMRLRRSMPGGIGGAIVSKGGDVRLKHFGARETRRGVSAAPRGKRAVFAGSFIRGGRFPNRKPIRAAWSGHVLRRAGPGRKPLVVLRSGVFIAEEMVSAGARDAFFATASAVLPRRLEHELMRLLGG